MKTTMQELIYDLKLLQEKDDVKLVNIESIISYASDKLEKEKEQIIDAWDKRGSTIVPRYFLEENITGEEYYNQTYNQNK
jgi:hypothetical protein